MINNTILNIVLILLSNVFKTLKQKHMLNLASSDKTSRNAVLPISAIIADLALHAFVGIHLRTFIVLHGYFSLGKTSGPTTKAAGSEVLLYMVLCNIRSRCISQEILVGFEQIHCWCKSKRKSMSVSSNYK